MNILKGLSYICVISYLRRLIVSSVCYLSPILEMVTEKYLLREEAEWRARHKSMKILDDLLLAIRRNDIRTIARLVTEK